MTSKILSLTRLADWYVVCYDAPFFVPLFGPWDFELINNSLLLAVISRGCKSERYFIVILTDVIKALTPGAKVLSGAALPFDFEGEREYLQELSSNLAGLAVTGTATLTGGKFTLKGDCSSAPPRYRGTR